MKMPPIAFGAIKVPIGDRSLSVLGVVVSDHPLICGMYNSTTDPTGRYTLRAQECDIMKMPVGSRNESFIKAAPQTVGYSDDVTERAEQGE
ncbi:MAG TPA: hypothetical protein VG122_01875 [Gemmata sp.]|nr:hypothetical protein [Gemmata sp.]